VKENKIYPYRDLFKNIFELSNKKFIFLLLSFLIIKNGIHPIGTEWIDWVYSAGRSFPNPENYLSYSIIPVLIAKIFNYPSYLIWWFIFFLFTLLFYSLIILKIKKESGDEFKKIVLIVFCFPFLSSPLYYLGHYDLITISGALIAGLTKSKKMVVLGSLIAIGSNSEQALMTSICVLFVSLGSQSTFHKYIAKIWMSLSLSGYVLLKILVGTSSDGNRIRFILGQLKNVLIDSSGRLNLIIFSVFGLGWIFIFMVHQIKNIFPRQLLVYLGAVITPVCLSIFILDRTRIGVAVGALPLIMLIKFIFDSGPTKNELLNKINFQYLIVAFLLVPTIFVDTDGSIRLPYFELIHRLLV
jgi:hypothetical protein